MPKREREEKEVPRTYIGGAPTDIDVLMGSKRKAFTQHPGSQRFLRIVEVHRQQYLTSSLKQVKSRIIRRILQEKKANGARFLKRDARGWYLATETAIFDKVGHTMRFEPSAAKRLSTALKRLPSPGNKSSSLKSPPPVTAVAIEKYDRLVPTTILSPPDKNVQHSPIRRETMAPAALVVPNKSSHLSLLKSQILTDHEADTEVDNFTLTAVERGQQEPQTRHSETRPIGCEEPDMRGSKDKPSPPESLGDATRPPLPQHTQPVCAFFRPLDQQSEEDIIEKLMPYATEESYNNKSDEGNENTNACNLPTTERRYAAGAACIDTEDRLKFELLL